MVPIINELMDRFKTVFASNDWHPEKTKHFEKWPLHCVQNTFGAAFHPQLEADKIQEVFLKGTSTEDDGYSAFEATKNSLEQFYILIKSMIYMSVVWPLIIVYYLQRSVHIKKDLMC